MSRIRKAYEAKFRVLLGRAGARRLEPGVQLLLAQADARACHERLSPTEAMTQVYRDTLRKSERWPQAVGATNGLGAPTRFLCDAGLGGLARWLRAAGYEAEWSSGIADDELLCQARQRAAMVLTTDSLLMERRCLRDGEIPAVWVPPSLKPLQQLALVFDELRLPVRDPLCMNCGGPLRPVDKEAVRERIPPRTYLWLDDYFLCHGCGQLFWHGTHWHHIQRRLAQFKPATGAAD